MKKALILLFILQALMLHAQDSLTRIKFFPAVKSVAKSIPGKKNIWVFFMAGQSNMAGRGWVEPKDTLPNDRILTIDKSGNIIYAKEPFHFYEPSLTGLDCGMSFALSLLPTIPQDVSILMVPVAIGGSSIKQWLGDSTYRGVKLFSNFKQKLNWIKEYGIIKGVIWHQGESDATGREIPLHIQRLENLFTQFRVLCENKNLPIILGELGAFSNSKENWSKMNEVLKSYTLKDKYSALIKTSDLNHKGDFIHFDSEGQRMMGQRFAAALYPIMMQ